MVRLDDVRDRVGFVVAPGQVGPDHRVRALDLVVDGLAQVVQQTGPLGQLGVRAQLRGHQSREVGDLERVDQHVLPVARAELQPAEQLDQFGSQAVDVGVEGRLLAGLLDLLVDLLLGLGEHLFDLGRMDATVGHQLGQRQAGDLAAHGVEPREHHGFGRVVDDEVDAGQVLEGADVAPLAPDDAALHVVGRQLDHRHGRLGHVAGGGPLDRMERM